MAENSDEDISFMDSLVESAKQTQQKIPQQAIQNDPDIAEMDSLLDVAKKITPEKKQEIPTVGETLHQIGYGKVTPEIETIAKSETDPERIRQFPTWFEKTPEQQDALYEFYKKRPVSESLMEAGKAALQNVPRMAKNFAIGAGQMFEGFFQGELMTPEKEAEMLKDDRSLLERWFPKKSQQAIKAFPEAIVGTGESIGRAGYKNVVSGNPFIDSIRTKLPDWTHMNLSETEAKQKFRNRDNIDTHIAQFDEKIPDVAARLREYSRPVTQKAANAIISHLTGSVDSIMAENPEMSRDEAAKYKQEHDEALAKDLIDKSIQHNIWNKPTPEMETFAGFTTPLGNEFAVASEAFKLLKTGAKLGKIAKTAEEADKLAAEATSKIGQKLEKQALSAEQQGFVGKVAGWAADKIEKGGEKIEDVLAKVPEPIRGYVAEELPLKKLSLTAPVAGAAVGAYEADEGNKLVGALKGGLAGSLIFAPRIVSDLSKAAVSAGKGSEDMFTRAMKMPGTSQATRIFSYLPSRKIPFKNESVARWVGDRVLNHVQEGVNTVALASALGIYDGANAQEVGRTAAEGLLLHFPHSYFNSLVGKNPRNIERENKRQDFDNIKTLRSMPETDRQKIQDISSWGNVTNHAREQYEEALKEYSAIPENKRDTKEAVDLAKNVTRLRAEFEDAQRATPETRQAYAREILSSITNNQNLLNGTVFPNRNVQIRVMNTQEIVDHLTGKTLFQDCQIIQTWILMLLSQRH
jgi:hypothetical protein